MMQLNQSDMVATFPNGSTILVAGLDDDYRVQIVLGLEFVTICLNESSETAWSSVSVVMTRLSQRIALLRDASVMMRPKFLADRNPAGSKHWTYALWIDKLKPGTTEALSNPDNYASIQVNPRDNVEDIDADYLESLGELSARDRRRFLDGEWSREVDGALFTQENIDQDRIAVAAMPEITRLVIAVDPAVTSGANADETGICMAGLGADGRVDVIADLSMKSATPQQWAEAVIGAYHRHGVDRVVAEVNQGGDMIETILRNIDRTVSYKRLWSSRGKVSRAEPVSSLY